METFFRSEFAAVAGVCTLLALGAALFHGASRFMRGVRLRLRFRKGRAGEHKARSWLKHHGFRILAEQADLKPAMLVDGQRHHFDIRADFLVSRRGRRGVVDAKTGARAPDPCRSATRRQLLEYAMYYGVDDIFLFDAERGKLVKVSFKTRAVPTPFPLGIWLAGACCGAAALWLFQMLV